MPADPYHLQRFVTAQAGTWPQALAEVRRGHKRSHWMWFIFPQLAGLGHSEAARHYAISGRGEAVAYLEHPLLGPRLREISAALLTVEGRSARDIFGTPDDLKLRSSMTLFATAAPQEPVFQQVLATYYHGAADRRTLDLLENP